MVKKLYEGKELERKYAYPYTYYPPQTKQQLWSLRQRATVLTEPTLALLGQLSGM